ncbi:hypothetical protein [Pseudarthrobacter sp. H2]|uniref:hypothetical protein n=1 Tax=Pseudarthrobacter sp. H2 TaxID=3418415 RepID=UPI003CF73BBC
MSISIGHRAIFTAFGHRNHSATRTTAPPAARETETRAAAEMGELNCSPWEGLYLEQARPAASMQHEATTGRQLGSFLTSLMYGE